MAHIGVTVGLCIYAPEQSLWFIVGGLLIDVDHIADHLLWNWRFDLGDFFTGEFLKSGNVYLIFHGWEIVFGILFFGLYRGADILIYAGTAMCLHLIIDQVQKRNPLSLFIFYRWAKRWKVETILPERHYEKREYYKV